MMKKNWLGSRYFLQQPYCGNEHQASGFTLVELLVSSVVLIVAVVGSIAAFNLIIQSARGTGIRADQSRRIDDDIAAITEISELYTSCVNPRGSVPASACTGTDVQVGNSFYYFPDPDDASFAANQAAFFDACRTNTDSNHITAGFISAINNPTVVPLPGGDVTRGSAVRVAPGVGDNHLVQIIWSDPTRNNRELRSIRTYPIVSSWCP